MLLRQADVTKTQLQLATQKRVLKPSDDPVAATSISFLQAEISQTEQYNRNADFAEASNNLVEGVYASTTNILFRVKELMVSLGNGVRGPDEIDAVGAELKERLAELLGLANTQNANGDYLFSGSQVKTQPFTQDSLGVISYQGDQSERKLRVSSGVVVSVSDAGFDVFQNVKDGNGKFSTNANNANTGTGVISTGDYSAPPSFLAEPYDITFALNAGVLEYTATGRTSGTVVAGPTTFQNGASINFNGVQLEIRGTPQAGDSFGVEPSTNRDLFSNIQDIIDAIDGYVDTDVGRAQFDNVLDSSQSSIDRNFQQINVSRSKLGGRLNAIESEMETNLSALVTSRTALSDIQDLDVVEASTRFSQQLVVLEAAQASFIRVQDLNLFNFIR
jgi:flagellar hook-associated protein 3 FlgL